MKRLQRNRKSRLRVILIALAVIILAVFAWHSTHHSKLASDVKSQTSTSTKVQVAKTPKQTPKPKPVPKPVGRCADNQLSQEILVSISARHMWACAGTTQVYDSAVITGMENLPADLTPVGTYKVYSKQTDQVLKGCDSTGCWNDPVSYWMPWLSNQYGIYGFHDATWRKASDFGNVSPYSSNASHGCVELPLATAKWVFDWAPIGTTVNIVS